MNLSAYVGLPWSDGGRSHDGYDCWGLVRLVLAERLGIELPSYSGAYVTAADREAVSTLIKGGMSDWRPVSAGWERPLDAVLMTEAGIPRHIGIVSSPGYVLHMPPGRDSVVEPYRFGRLKMRVAGFFRHAQVT
jgi:cell wall-associated NlpC family hydrolase